MEAETTTINIGETSRESKGKAPLLAETAVVSSKPAMARANGGYRRAVAVFDLVLRLAGVAAALGATIAMGTTDQTLPFFTQFFQFQASYDDLPAFTFFVIANAIAASYLVLSIPFSIVCIIRPHAAGPRLLLIFFDAAILALITAAAGAAAAIVYLAHNGNPNANWNAICQQFNNFCQKVSGAVVASFLAVLVFMALVVMSAFSL